MSGPSALPAGAAVEQNAGVDVGPGLTDVEVEERRRLHGPNRLVPEPRRAVVPRWLWQAVTDPMAVLLMLAVPVYLAIGDVSDAVITLVALIPVAGVGWLLESRAARALDRLRALTAVTVSVVRDGRAVTVPAEDLVPDDVMVVQEGDVIAADALLLDSTQLMVDESSLTGESQPVVKSTGANGSAVSPDRELLAGTTVLSGRGVARVTVTGERTRYGRIGRLVASVEETPAPLQRDVSRLVRTLGVVAALCCVAVVSLELSRGRGWGSALIAGISLAIAAIPEEFPMVYTLYLGLGAWRLARERALVRRLSGVETLGSTTVICSDKTGTLTLGSLSVDRVSLPQGSVEPASSPAARDLLAAAVLACEPQPFDPLEHAIVTAARAAGVDVDALHGGELVVDHPFDPVGRYLTHVWRFGDGYRVAAKGAAESLGALVGTDLAEANHRLAQGGLRVIAVAEGVLAAPTGDRAADEAGLRISGLIGFSDPLRPGVAEALRTCAAAGIRVVMITGDHPVTAHAVAEGLGLDHHGMGGRNEIATGEELDAVDDAGLQELAGRVNVFARMRPEQKHRLVEALHARREVVAMTGDGINDAPALRQADIGIAMGERGTAVARESAVMVLLDDNFSTIVAAVRDGRRIFDNLVRAFAYLVSFHIPLLLVALVAPVADQPLLLLPVHLVLLELVVHPVVSLVFENDPPDPDVMSRPPRSAAVGLARRTGWYPYALGLTLSGAVLGVYAWALGRGYADERARAMGFAVLLLGQGVLILASRGPGPLWRSPLRGNPALLPVLVAVALLTVAVVHVGPLADLLSLEPLRPGDWAVVIAAAVAATGWRLRSGPVG